jgi:hypothetical protein
MRLAKSHCLNLAQMTHDGVFGFTFYFICYTPAKPTLLDNREERVFKCCDIPYQFNEFEYIP